MNVFLDDTCVTCNKKRDVFRRLYYGDMGVFFNPLLDRGACSDTIFPRLEKIIRGQKSDVFDMLPVTTNYVRTVARLVSGFVWGSGVKMSLTSQGEAEGQETEDANNQQWDDFLKWWREWELDLQCDESMARALAMGYAGIKLVPRGDIIKPKFFSYDEYFADDFGNHYFYEMVEERGEEPDQSEAQPDGDPETDEKDNTAFAQQYVYLMTVYKNGQGKWEMRHQMFEHQKSAVNRLGAERPEMLEEYFPDIQGLDSEGFVKDQYDYLPFVLIKSRHRDDDGKGMSIFQDSLSKVQALIFALTEASIELQENFLSRFTLPMDFFQRDPSTGTKKNLEKLQNIPLIDGAPAPGYIQKELEGPWNVLQGYIDVLKAEIAFELNIPADLLVKNKGGEERVALAKIRQQPFARLVQGYQDVAEHAVTGIIQAYCMMKNIPVFEVEFMWDDVFGEMTLEERMYIKTLLDDGIISMKQFYRMEYPDLTEDQIDDRMDEAKEERDKNQQEQANRLGGIARTQDFTEDVDAITQARQQRDNIRQEP